MTHMKYEIGQHIEEFPGTIVRVFKPIAVLIAEREHYPKGVPALQVKYELNTGEVVQVHEQA